MPFIHQLLTIILITLLNLSDNEMQSFGAFCFGGFLALHKQNNKKMTHLQGSFLEKK